MTLDLYVDLRSQTLIQSHKNGGKFVVPRQYREQLIPLRMFYVSPNATGGAANPYTLEDSSAYTSVRVGIGGFDNPLAVSSAMTWNSAILGWEGGTLDLNTVEMSDAVDAASGGELSQIFETEAFHSGSLIKTQDSVVVKRTVLTSSGGLPNPVSNTNFANILELILVDSDTIDVERTGNEFQFHVRRKALGGIGADVDGIYTQRIGDAPAILSELATGFATTAPSGSGFAVTPTDDSVTATVGGVAGQCYKIKARVVGQIERKSISGGIQTPADNALAYRGGTPAANNFNLWFLEISDPAQVIHLNRIAGAEGQPYTVGADYFVDFLAYAGATVTLAFDTLDGLSYLANGLTVTQEMAEEVSSCGGAPEAHASTHEDGGADEINVAGLSGLLADGQTPLTHASTHQNGGTDEISVAGLSGLLADGQTPLAHIASHAPGGSDALPWTTIHGRGTTGAKPAAAAGNAGYLYFDTTLTKLQRSTGSAWEDVAEPGATTSYSLTASTSDATQTELLTADAARLTLPDSTAWGFTALFTGRYNGISAFNTWTARDSSRVWSGVASSSDGTKLAATVASGQIYTSTDSGVTWTARATVSGWSGVASSSDGTKLAAATFGGQIYTSTDSGVTWTARDSNRHWSAIASSSDGTKLAATVENGQIYTSTDSGVTWTARDSNRQWEAVASSDDGTKLIAADIGGALYTSTNSGVNWTARDSSRYWRGVASSSDGVKLVAVVATSGQIYTSADSGVNWTARDSNRDWRGVASSSDGTKLIACVDGGQLYTSADSGVNWTARDSNRAWTAAASSSDGTKLIACVDGGQLYTASLARHLGQSPHSKRTPSATTRQAASLAKRTPRTARCSSSPQARPRRLGSGA